MKFCTKCGQQIHDEAIICVHCGCQIASAAAPQAQKNDKKLVSALSQKLDTYGTVAIAIGIFQVLTLVGLFMGLMNIYAGIVNKKSAKLLLDDPRDIVKRYSPAGGAILLLIFNLFLGAVIGVIATIYWLVAVRGYVLNNIDEFERIDQNAK